MDYEKLRKVLSGEITDNDLLDEIIYCIDLSSEHVKLPEIEKSLVY
jgi:hypothetical protein